MSEVHETEARNAQPHIDVAALSAGVIAVAVTTMLTPGVYGGSGAILSLTLFILIISYSWSGTRELAHSIAFSAVIALVGMELVAVAIEFCLWPTPKVGLFLGSDFAGAADDAATTAWLKTCLAGKPVPAPACPSSQFAAQLALEQLGLKDKSRVAFQWLALAWIVIACTTLAIDRGFVFPGRWWPNSRVVARARLRSKTSRGG